MENNHSCVLITPRSTDYLMGDGHLSLTSVLPSGNWLPYFDFFERQMLQAGDTDGCVLFSAQETFDAIIDQRFLTLPDSIVQMFNDMGYMDEGTDGKMHFHSSPRWLQILTGNGLGGNNVYDAWDVMRKYGVLPYKDLPVDSTMSPQEYVNPKAITQTMRDKAQQFLISIGGKQAIQYHWVCNGHGNPQARMQALQAAPLCIGVNVGAGWNSLTPPPPADGLNPGHCVAEYFEKPGEADVFDHYLPNPKHLIAYPIWYALQAIVTITPLPPIPVLPTPITPVQTQTWLSQFILWLQDFATRLGKGRITSNQMNYNILKSRTFWTLVVGFAYNIWQLFQPTVAPQVSAVLDVVFGFLTTYFHVAGVQNASTTPDVVPPAAPTA